MKTEKTPRGFGIIEFKDSYEQECSIQDSSSVDPKIWLGVDNTGKQISDQHGVFNSEVGARMHLDADQVEALVSILQKWLKNYRLPKRYKKI